MNDETLKLLETLIKRMNKEIEKLKARVHYLELKNQPRARRAGPPFNPYLGE